MIGFFRRWRAKKRERAALIQRARVAFHAKYPDCSMTTWALPPEQTEDGVYVVTVCYDNLRPPHRSWWRVTEDQEKVEELSYKEASRIVRIPLWR